MPLCLHKSIICELIDPAMSSPIGTIEITPTIPVCGEVDILATLHLLEMPRDEYFVIGGANMVLRGIKEVTSDLDVLVSDALFDELSLRPDTRIKEPPAPAIARGAKNKTAWVESNQLCVPLSATTSLGDGYYPMCFTSHYNHVDP